MIFLILENMMIIGKLNRIEKKQDLQEVKQMKIQIFYEMIEEKIILLTKKEE